MISGFITILQGIFNQVFTDIRILDLNSTLPNSMLF